MHRPPEVARYFKRFWDEPRGDAYDSCGTSWWYFELDSNGWPSRQLELYADGTLLRYDVGHAEDELGGLGDQPLDLAELAAFEIDAAEFEARWSAGDARNQRER
ncbi:MAG TPA: hypothetical protein PLR99_23350 [Polyangiaceae bacterium]|nr:hypothetical protein [Polyangiaceae bacterium]